MPSFGEKLRLERERQNITLDHVSVSTKISIRLLRAIEEDHFNQLPGGIFNKGFIRAYARVLGLDEEQTLAEYLKISGNIDSHAQAGTVVHDGALTEPASRRGLSRENAAPDSGSAKNELNLDRVEASARPLDNQLPWGVFAALLLLLALTLSLWSRFERGRSKEEAVIVPSSSPAPTLPTAQPTSGATQTKTSAPRNPSPTSGAPVGNSPPSVAPSAGPSEFSLVIQARKESWITITADGKPLSSELMTAGTERTVRGTKQVTVKAGNAGAIEFQFNGQKFPAPGELGQVKTVTFGPKGII